LDPDFCSDIVNLRIAEVSYKLNQIDEALEAIEKCELAIREKDKYMVYLLKGKCFDRQKKYLDACEHYQLAIDAAQG